MHARLANAALLLLLLCGVSIAAGCSRARKDEQKHLRALLAAPPRPDPQALARQSQILDEHGELIASDQVVAGLTLPRGLTQVMSFPHEWYLKGRQVPAEALERYVLARISPREINRSRGGAVTFTAAQLKEDPSAQPIFVRI